MARWLFALSSHKSCEEQLSTSENTSTAKGLSKTLYRILIFKPSHSISAPFIICAGGIDGDDGTGLVVREYGLPISK